MIPDTVGYGAGRRELENTPNILRLIVGHADIGRFERDSVQIVETNLDDVSGEIVGGAVQRILEAGAKDVWVTSAQFKKNRPGFVLHAICGHEKVEEISRIIMAETGTLGVRYQPWDRFILKRETVTIKLEFGARTFDVRIKVARDRLGEIVRIKPEYEDVDSISRATAVPAREISALALEKARKVLEEKYRND